MEKPIVPLTARAESESFRSVIWWSLFKEQYMAEVRRIEKTNDGKLFIFDHLKGGEEVFSKKVNLQVYLSTRILDEEDIRPWHEIVSHYLNKHKIKC